MTLASAAQACSNQTGNMLANMRCSFDQPHTSAVTSAGYNTGKAAPMIIGVIVILLFLAMMSRSRSRSAATSK